MLQTVTQICHISCLVLSEVPSSDKSINLSQMWRLESP